MNLLRHQSVLHVMSDSGAPWLMFTRDIDEPGDIPDSLVIDRDTWDEMGSPDSVTITVEPGDQLNG